jgi:hypothetical protein
MLIIYLPFPVADELKQISSKIESFRKKKISSEMDFCLLNNIFFSKGSKEKNKNVEPLSISCHVRDALVLVPFS